MTSPDCATLRVSIEDLTQIILDVLAAAGLTIRDAQIVCGALVDAECSGRKGHGLSRLPGLAKRSAGAGADLIRVAMDSGPVVALDGGGALGYLTAHRAARMAIERLAAHPTAAVACRNTSHAGAIGYYARLAAAAGHCALAVAHCSPMLAPVGGNRPVFGTNPIAFACPGPRHPLVADLSPARITYGAIMNAHHAGASIPSGVAIDSGGRPTTDPLEALEGAILPIADAKGSALAFIVQALCVLCGAAASPAPGEDYAFLIVGFRTDAFVGAPRFVEGILALEDAVHNAGAICPGERSEKLREIARRDGLEVDQGLWKTVQELRARRLE